MRTGLLWFDDSKTRTLEEKVQRAKEHYAAKYYVEPDRAFVHPSTLGDKEELVINGVTIKGSNLILPNHIWIGISD